MLNEVKGSTVHLAASLYRRKRNVVLVVSGILVVLGLVVWLLAGGIGQEEYGQAEYPLRYSSTIQQAARAYDVEPALAAGVIHTESRFRPRAESAAAAYGLMQIRPQTSEFISGQSGIQGNYRTASTNLQMGIWYLGYLKDRYQADNMLMLAAYNAGPGQVDAWLEEDGLATGSDIPFDETRRYVEAVPEARDAYAELYGTELARGEENNVSNSTSL